METIRQLYWYERTAKKVWRLPCYTISTIQFCVPKPVKIRTTR